MWNKYEWNIVSSHTFFFWALTTWTGILEARICVDLSSDGRSRGNAHQRLGNVSEQQRLLQRARGIAETLPGHQARGIQNASITLCLTTGAQHYQSKGFGKFWQMRSCFVPLHADAAAAVPREC